MFNIVNYRITSNNSRGSYQFFIFFPAGIIRGIEKLFLQLPVYLYNWGISWTIFDFLSFETVPSNSCFLYA